MSDNFFNIALLMLFIAAFFAIEGVYIWWNSRRGPEATRLAKRLRMISAGGGTDPAELALLKRRLTSNSPAFDRVMLLVPRVETLDRFLVQSGTDWTLPNFATYTVSLFGMGLFGLLLFGKPLLIALVGGLAMGLLPILYLSHRRSRRLKRFESLLPEALDLIGRALRAGHALPSALQMAGTEMPDPVGEEFQQTFDEINFGISAQDALQNLARRVPSTDLGFFVIAVLIQRETGGNLSEILSNISNIIRERLKLFGKVKALSAESRFSGLVLILLPVFTGALLYAVDSEFMSMLWTDPTGILFLKGGVIFMIIGALWMRRIVRIHV
ncbi:type II secretion system F family protein [Cognatazoarcus halotolerans]|uniref:type II secretion system F family protein n=1 Tax=Cognatazoarcus halotolerans TaxID=2686016 RepID=UPI00190F7E83|nr:type II secretion system F family protein [Cognatazoarcus halotolerans]